MIEHVLYKNKVTKSAAVIKIERELPLGSARLIDRSNTNVDAED